MRIESTTNPRVKAVRRLHRNRERRTLGRTLLEGPKLLEAALDAGVLPLEVYATKRTEVVERAEVLGVATSEVSRAVLEAMSTTIEPQDSLAIMEIPASGRLEAQQTVVLVDVSDPGNLGTLIRTAAALGWRVALLGGADPWNPKVLRSGAGAHFAQPLVEISDLSEIVEAGLTSVATVVSGGRPPEDIKSDSPIALLIGSESHGLASEMVDRCQQVMTVPMSAGAESLNAAVAGGIAMFALSQSREIDPSRG